MGNKNMADTKILAFAGSTRKLSYNKRILKYAVEGARHAGAEVTVIDLKDFPLPLFDGDLEKEEGKPENAQKLFDLFMEHQGLLIASPEYNSAISGVLKNAIDWISRPVPHMKPLAAFDHRVAALMAASTGSLGGLRGLASLRLILGNIKVIVLPDQVGIPKAADLFEGDDDKIMDEKKQHSLEHLGKRLHEVIVKLA
jgi:chromate reductase, NAD(P)H dehydrogenase (quinone)